MDEEYEALYSHVYDDIRFNHESELIEELE